MSDKVKLNCPLCVEKTEHEFISEHGDYNEVYKVSCGKCLVHHMIPRKDWFSWVKDSVSRGPAYRTKWPFVDPFMGVVVKSKDHQREEAKRLGFVEQKHAISVKSQERKKIKVDRGLW